jgi:hypothetical protein
MASIPKRRPRDFADTNELVETHVRELDTHNGSDVDGMVDDAFTTAAFILYAHHDGDIEDTINEMGSALRRAIRRIERYRALH